MVPIAFIQMGVFLGSLSSSRMMVRLLVMGFGVMGVDLCRLWMGGGQFQRFGGRPATVDPTKPVPNRHNHRAGHL